MERTTVSQEPGANPVVTNSSLGCPAKRDVCVRVAKKRELLWAHWAAEQLLEDVPHRHVVFSLPKRLRIFFRYDRKLLASWPAVLGEPSGCILKSTLTATIS